MNALEVNKTYKLYIGGKFPRSESGRSLPLKNKEGKLIANVSRATPKDFRQAALAARNAYKTWSSSTAFLRSQILYRVAEMMQGRREQLQNELIITGMSSKSAQEDVQKSIDLIVHYAGWCDKYQQIFSTVNPVASPHFNFSMPEARGMVGIIAHDRGILSDLCAAILPIITGANTCIVLAPIELATCAINLGEIFQTSDLPSGTVNILTGKREELLAPMASHRDMDGLLLFTDEPEEKKQAGILAAEHILHLVVSSPKRQSPSPYHIMDFLETKTTWHPMGY